MRKNDRWNSCIVVQFKEDIVGGRNPSDGERRCKTYFKPDSCRF